MLIQDILFIFAFNMKKDVKILAEKRFEHPLMCMNCGAKLPVELVDVQGRVEMMIFCKHCKTVTLLGLSPDK